MSKFNQVCVNGEWLDGFQIEDISWSRNGICKRCGNEFTKKYRSQIFCSRKCAAAHNDKVNDMEAKYGKDFIVWWKKIHSQVKSSEVMSYDEWHKRV